MAGSDDEKMPKSAVRPGAEIVGESAALKEVFEIAQIVARSNTPVLLRGESGTGKEFFAKLIHDSSPRREKPFVKLNCAALSAGVLESELFGHEKGAFTGAASQKVGRFELAHGGTLLLDEIGEISAEFQTKLLRVLQEGELERVGGTRTLKVNVRLVCATNKDLETAVAAGEFRADLYYRINVVPITLPPLRQRDGDIPRLAQVFLRRFNKENGRSLSFAPSTLDILSKCEFPGNIRELQNCTQRTATLARSDIIVPQDLACEQGRCYSPLLKKAVAERVGKGAVHGLARGETVSMGQPRDAAVFAAEAVMGHSGLIGRERLEQAMATAGGNQAKAARLLGRTPRQVGYSLRRHGIERKLF
ncbi:nif-specific transcriptional activator NifA (plasmid) [Rhizobium leguminosarum]|uniref:Nif-specific regulatory protein n=1 Tax=Rhizobium beringeri TaxID=3019934 RepID=A0ABY1XJQ3_9HYPH|nr:MULTISPECIES: nif-specific transcriptional activator NifA [Rhizobium]TAU13468.1 nif-specific transcriptional activator NifA [Rhizobium leguminosarum]TAU80036.1 nif-specific transcriptional activator NifA [Rhizobium leguminosarum]TBE59007.1 nif-specific transcriptional activator NifA [Rhizobium beringeri]